ncbi:23S rRNA pseudouridylate synthase [Ahniella affigens]|uniref:Pseudouridine synthase n=1 Tax=Ahniella affigens TaxID=2021234 RepID=A0A2P1PUJ2_9GAMM|nr:pseudouridine synthase [Ahniella affigens]AVP98515.1 23S rRNA pseudouridylate synthase [Ahniella affigens]
MLVALNKPYGVLCQFSGNDGRPTLADVIQKARTNAWIDAGTTTTRRDDDFANIYPAGRLDLDSEGLLLLSDDGPLIHQISDPREKWPKTYWVQVEHLATDAELDALRHGVVLNDGPTLPASVRCLADADAEWLWPRDPPIRVRAAIPTCWLEIVLREGRNRQVRRMTAAVGLPTLRLIRTAIGPYRLDGLLPGHLRILDGQPAPARMHVPRQKPLRPRFPKRPKR